MGIGVGGLLPLTQGPAAGGGVLPGGGAGGPEVWVCTIEEGLEAQQEGSEEVLMRLSGIGLGEQDPFPTTVFILVMATDKAAQKGQRSHCCEIAMVV